MTTPQTFIQKIAYVQSELKVPKDKKAGGKGFAYPYRNAEQILSKVKPYLVEHDLILTLDDEIIEIQGRYFLKATALITDGTDRITATAYAELMRGSMNESQATGATSSYARKYALGGLLGIDEGKDADHEDYQQSRSPEPDPGFHQAYLDKPLQGGATDKQINMIQLKRNQLKANDPAGYEIFKAYYEETFEGRKLKDLSKQEASKLIEKLNGEEQ